MLHSRIKRVNHLLRNTLSEILLSDVTDPRLKFVTVADVDVTKDLRKAHVFVSVLSDEENAAAEALEALDKARGYIKALLSERVELKFLPDLQFHIHKGARHAARIDQILRDLSAEDETETESDL